MRPSLTKIVSQNAGYAGVAISSCGASEEAEQLLLSGRIGWGWDGAVEERRPAHLFADGCGLGKGVFDQVWVELVVDVSCAGEVPGVCDGVDDVPAELGVDGLASPERGNFRDNVPG